MKRRLFGARHGRISIGVQEVQEDHCICILYGAGIPFVLKRHFEYNFIVGETCRSRLDHIFSLNGYSHFGRCPWNCGW